MVSHGVIGLQIDHGLKLYSRLGELSVSTVKASRPLYPSIRGKAVHHRLEGAFCIGESPLCFVNLSAEIGGTRELPGLKRHRSNFRLLS